MDEPLSNDAIFKALNINNTYVIKYSELSNYNSLTDAFGRKPFIIILIESNTNSGHWVCMYRKSPNHYIYFNSYGRKYDNDLDFISKIKNKILGNDVNTINKLMDDNDIIDYNHIKYQSDITQVCGRYCIDFVRNMNKGLSLKQYQTYLKDNKSGSYDNTILLLTGDLPGMSKIYIYLTYILLFLYYF